MALKGVKIWHNPKCGTSRNALALLRERGIEPEIIEYLKTPPSIAELSGMVKRSGLGARAFVRSKEKLYSELNLSDPKLTDAQIVKALAENPVLLNRPVVETAKGIKPCRPAESVLELLD